MHILFNFDKTSTLHALIRDCTLIYFSDSGITRNLFWQKLGLFSGNFCSFGSLVTCLPDAIASAIKPAYMRFHRNNNNSEKSVKSLRQNYTLHAYSGLRAYLILVKIPTCTLIRACTLIQHTRVMVVHLEFSDLILSINSLNTWWFRYFHCEIVYFSYFVGPLKLHIFYHNLMGKFGLFCKRYKKKRWLVNNKAFQEFLLKIQRFQREKTAPTIQPVQCYEVKSIPFFMRYCK